MDNLFGLPQWFTTFTVVLTSVVGAVVVVLNVLDKKLKEREALSDNLQEKIKKLYQEESAAQDSKIQEQAVKIKDLGERLATVEGENKTMRSILQGTDANSTEYRKRVEATLILVDQLAKIIALNGTKTDAILKLSEKTNENIEKLIRAIGKNGSKK